MFNVADAYPADAIGGADFLTGAALRRIVDDWGDGQRARRERVIVADRVFDMDDDVHGRPCFAEETVRALGQAIGMGDAPYVARLERDLRRERQARAIAEQELARAHAALEQIKVVKIQTFIAPDGTAHPTRESVDCYLADREPLPERDPAPLPEGVPV